MRKATIKGKEIQLTEKQFKKLQSRFNPRNFKTSQYTKTPKNDQACYFCATCYTYLNGCLECPFGILEGLDGLDGLGCFMAIMSILTKNEETVFYKHVSVSSRYISYNKNSKRAAEIISKIYSAINEGFKKVKRRKLHIKK